MTDDYSNDHGYKIVVLGDSAAGKTSLIMRYTRNLFDQSVTTTIGASFVTKKIVHMKNEVCFRLWDTAGQERYRSVIPVYCRGASAVIIVFDSTIENFAEPIQHWVDFAKNNADEGTKIYVVGNKIDLRPEETFESISEYLESENLKLFPVSALSGVGIDRLFTEIANDVCRCTNLPQDEFVSMIKETNPSRKACC